MVSFIKCLRGRSTLWVIFPYVQNYTYYTYRELERIFQPTFLMQNNFTEKKWKCGNFVDFVIFESVLSKGPSTKCDHVTRVCTNKNDENEKCQPLKNAIITLIHVLQRLLWGFLAESIFYFLHFCSYELS